MVVKRRQAPRRLPDEVTPTPGLPPPPPPITDPVQDLVLASQAIFDGESNTFTVTLDGVEKEVTVRPAKMKQMDEITSFFGAALTFMNPDNYKELVEVFVNAQKEALKAGIKPSEISVKNLVTEDSIKGLIKQSPVLMDLVGSVMKLLPKLAPIFSNLTEEEFQELELDQGTLVSSAIFLLNYRFFTQSLRPVLMASIRSWAFKRAVSLGKNVQAIR